MLDAASRVPPVEAMRTFQGEQSLHWFSARSTWHPAQQTRQIKDVLRLRGIEPTTPLPVGVLDRHARTASVYRGRSEA